MFALLWKFFDCGQGIQESALSFQVIQNWSAELVSSTIGGAYQTDDATHKSRSCEFMGGTHKSVCRVFVTLAYIRFESESAIREASALVNPINSVSRPSNRCHLSNLTSL